MLENHQQFIRIQNRGKTKGNNLILVKNMLSQALCWVFCLKIFVFLSAVFYQFCCSCCDFISFRSKLFVSFDSFFSCDLVFVETAFCYPCFHTLFVSKMVVLLSAVFLILLLVSQFYFIGFQNSNILRSTSADNQRTRICLFPNKTF